MGSSGAIVSLAIAPESKAMFSTEQGNKNVRMWYVNYCFLFLLCWSPVTYSLIHSCFFVHSLTPHSSHVLISLFPVPSYIRDIHRVKAVKTIAGAHKDHIKVVRAIDNYIYTGGGDRYLRKWDVKVCGV